MNGLGRRRIENSLGGGRIHLTIHDGPDDRDEYNDSEVPCCMAGAMHGPRGCTCWEAVFDIEQADPAGGEMGIRAKCCHDCAYLNGSPEREDGYTDELVDLAGTLRDQFACHQGMRRVTVWRHPDGREIPAGNGDYRPPFVDGVAYKADGTPADLCAGWASHRAALLAPEHS